MSKGQPDFFGQPQQIRYGSSKIFLSTSASIAVGEISLASFSGKGLLTKLTITLLGALTPDRMYVVLSCDGVQFVLVPIMPIGISLMSLVPRWHIVSQFYDVSNGNGLFVSEFSEPFENSCSIAIYGQSTVTVAGSAKMIVTGSEIV